LSPQEPNNFLELLKFSEPERIKKELSAIDELQHREVVTFLVNTIYGPDDIETSRAAIQVMQYIKKDLVLKELVDLATADIHPELRMSAIRVLGSLKEETAIPILEKIVNRSDDAQIIQTASIAIQVIQGITEDTSQDN
jgi:HEAT repeat protein